MRADDKAPAPVPVTTALSATTISGYVDTSAVWNPGTGNAHPAPYSFNAGKQDGFNVDMVDLKVAKPMDESQWAAGYVLELMYGPDANAVDSSSQPIRQAYVSLRTPVGNGIDWQIGQWDNLLGYESTDSYKNPNWTRSYGYTLEPTEHVGVLATYKVNDVVSAQVGVADSVTTIGGNGAPAFGNARGSAIESKKGVVSLLSLTAPDSFGDWKGSALYVGADYGPGLAFDKAGPGGHQVDKTHLYVGATINTPVKDLTLGAAWDSVNNMDTGAVEGAAMTVAGYVSYKITDKITSNARAEYAHGSAFDNLLASDPTRPNGGVGINGAGPQEAKVFALTETIQYDLWANVISRLEVRWDSSADGSPHFGATNPTTGGPTKNNEITVAANVLYKF